MRLLVRQARSLRLHFGSRTGPRPDILVGGLGQRTLDSAARYADAWNGIASPGGLFERRERLRRLCVAYGRSPDAVEISATVRSLVSD